jgi:hypothetical protein
MEHRWGERIKVDIPVQISAPPLSLRPARISNLSLSGACIAADYDLRALSRVDVIIDTTKITAYVTRSNKNGIGVEWCDYAPPIINEFMQSHGTGRGGRLRSADRPNRRLEALFLKHDG